MGVELPRNRRDLLPVASTHAVRRYTRRSPWQGLAVAASLGTALVLVLIRARLEPGGVPAHATPWALAPILAVAGWVYAARRSSPRAGIACWIMAATAGAGFLASLVGLGLLQARPPGAPTFPLTAYVLLPADIGIALAVGAALGRRRWALLNPTLAAETLLLLLAGAVATLRLVVEPTLASGSGSGGAAVPALLQTASLLPLLAASLLILRRSSALAPRAALLLFVATLSFSGAVFLSLTDSHRTPFAPGDPVARLWAAGWVMLAVAGFLARTEAPTATAMLAGRKAHDALRKLIVPAVAAFVALAVIDLGLGPAPRQETVLALALLAAVLAVRTAQTAGLADRAARQRRQLAHKEALVEVTHSLAGTTDLDAALRVIAEAARSVFGTRGAGIELLTEDGLSLETRHVVGLSADLVGVRFPVDRSFTGWVVRHGEPRATADPSRDPYIQQVSRPHLGRSPMAAAPIQLRGESLGVLYACIRLEPFDPDELGLMGALAEQAAIAIENARLFEQVRALSVTDPLTGLGNRRQLERELQREFAAARRGRPLAATIFDLDGFKRYNDTYGHPAGDEALRAFAAALAVETRTMNLAVRYGGDEFVALLSGANAGGAGTFIARVRERFAASIEGLGRGGLTVSAGSATYGDVMREPADLIRAADADLYRSKTRVST